ncbi:unnamed protein product [Phytophthora fragariaefolia]|uniref:Unnamed protein product n=1 Tax=Phytophthora fragariaefolia TaxID=1490495 RepID=A0A9W6XJS0_9STRA|nr:unnamed protein product [Phytophthora fragariaefolia]
MLSLIGESLQDEDDVCGAVVSVRKAQDRIAIWSATANAEDRQKAIGRGFRQALVDLGKNETLKYQSHADAAASGSSFQNEVYVRRNQIAVFSSIDEANMFVATQITDCMRLYAIHTQHFDHFNSYRLLNIAEATVKQIMATFLPTYKYMYEQYATVQDNVSMFKSRLHDRLVVYTEEPNRLVVACCKKASDRVAFKSGDEGHIEDHIGMPSKRLQELSCSGVPYVDQALNCARVYNWLRGVPQELDHTSRVLANVAALHHIEYNR